MNFLRQIRVIAGVVFVVASAGARVVFNEVQSSNDTTFFDEDEASSDWIELYNDGTDPVALGGWGLSDKASKPMKWVFPAEARIEARSHLLVWASGKDRTNQLARAELAPDAVRGLCLWLNGDDAAARTSHGSRIQTWYDLSGKANHATQSTTSYRPTLVTNAVNGHAALKFSHSASQMFYLPTTAFNGLSSLSNVSVYAACRWSGTSTTAGLFGQWRSGDSTPNCHFEVQKNGLLRWRLGAVDLKVSDALAANAWTTVAGFSDMSRESPHAALYKDGVRLAETETAIGSTSFAQATRLYVGNACDEAGARAQRGFDGLIAEVAVFDHALTQDERLGVDLYFARRYGEAKPSYLHTNFSLGGSGETLTLTRPDGTVADTAVVGRVPCDASWGRVTDGADAWGWFADPTPDAPNAGTVFAAPLEPVVFTPPRGVYTTTQRVALSHPDPTATIYYTLDHSEPSATNGVRYAGVPIPVTRSAFIRATAVKDGTLPCRNVMTHSYLFLADAAVNPGIPAGFPSTWSDGGTSRAVYGVSSNVVKTAQQRADLVKALQSAPILSVVLPDAQLFGSTEGVYTHPNTAGREAAASCEWIGTNGLGRVQIDAGLRAQGAASRNFGNQPKKSFRLCFRGRYGAGSLDEPVLDGAGCAQTGFNSLILRAEYNNAWTHHDGNQRPRGSFVRDQFLRDIFREMDEPGASGTQVHLFLNGYYWGYYNLSERPDAAFGETYLGGRADEWDVIKSHAEVRDGNISAWNAMYAATAGTLSTAAGYAAVTNLLDVVNFADYMLLNHWGGNQDWPQNNWVAMRRRADGERFRFCAWDAERTLENVTDNRLNASDEHPGRIHSRLLASSAYKTAYARRARRHLHPRHGLLAATNTVARWERMCAAVEPNAFAEAARWGSYRKEVGNATVGYGVATWQAERVRVRDSYLPARSSEFQARLKAAGLWVDYPTAEEYVFLPSDKANWDDDDNWSTDVYPDLPGAKARVLAPPAEGVDPAKGWRNVRVKDHQVVVGTLTFENGAFMNRVCNKDAVEAGKDYGVVFDPGTAAAGVLAVRDVSGPGCTVFDNGYPTRFVKDLRVVVDNPQGSSEYGALRLQQTWEGAGTFIKEGRGRCSLTGAGKNWTGGTRVRAGLLSATAKAFPPGVVMLETGASFLVVGAKASEIGVWRPRFVLDPQGLAAPETLHLWVRISPEGLVFSARVASPGTALVFR